MLFNTRSRLNPSEIHLVDAVQKIVLAKAKESRSLSSGDEDLIEAAILTKVGSGVRNVEDIAEAALLNLRALQVDGLEVDASQQP